MAYPTEVSFRNYDSSHLPGFLMEPNGVDSRPCTLLVQGERVEGISGAGFLDKEPALPANRYEFEFACETRAERKSLERFFDARLGRWEPFWFPTWERNAKVVGNITHGLYIESNGYDALFALGPQFRRFILMLGDSYQVYEVTGVHIDDPTPGTTRLDTAEFENYGTAFDLGTPSPPYPWDEAKGITTTALRYGRFDDDGMAVTIWPNGGGLVRVPIIELPDEARD